MDEGEDMSSDLSRTEKELAQERVESARQIESLRDRLGMLSENHKTSVAERKELVAQMGSRLVAKYERIKDGRGGHAVVVISGEVCAGCHTTLPPQFAAEIRKGDEILTCENCGRILIWEEKS